MTVIATALKHLLAAGVTGDALVTAIAEIEAATLDAERSKPAPVSKGAERQARYRARNRQVGRLSDVDWLPLKGAVIRRDGCCQYCGTTERLTADHVVPLSRGGSNDLENLVCACIPCNASKGGRTVEEWKSGAGPHHGDVTLRNGDAPLPSEVSPTPPSYQPSPEPTPFTPLKGGVSPSQRKELVEAIFALQPVVGGRRKSGRPDIDKALGSALNRGGASADILAALTAFYALPASLEADGKFANGAAVMLNNDRWRDFLPGGQQPQAPPRPAWTGPAELRAWIAEEAGGEAFAVGHVDPTKWDPTHRWLIAPNVFLAKRLTEQAPRSLAKGRVTVITAAQAAQMLNEAA